MIKPIITIHGIERLASSRNGNPRWEVTACHDNGYEHLPGAVYRTEVDGQVGYVVGNFRVGQRVQVWVERGAIVHMTEAPD